MEPLIDSKVEEQFHKLVKSFLSKNENYDTSKFIGGMPITLEKTDMPNLMLKGQNGGTKYTVTQKVDGTRYLMYIGPDTGVANVKQRQVCFVDRNMKLNVLSANIAEKTASELENYPDQDRKHLDELKKILVREGSDFQS